MAWVLSPRSLWYVVFGVLAVSALLVFGAFQFPWFTARYEGSQDVRGEFQFERYEIFYPADEDEPLLKRSYDSDVDRDGSPDLRFGQVMERTSLLWTFGFLGLLAYGASLALHFLGVMRGVKVIFLAWILMVGLLVVAFGTYTAQAGTAANRDVEFLAAFYFGEDVSATAGFWGDQTMEEPPATLRSRPGAGWWLALLGLLNVAGSSLLVLRMPRGAVEATSPPGAGAL